MKDIVTILSVVYEFEVAPDKQWEHKLWEKLGDIQTDTAKAPLSAKGGAGGAGLWRFALLTVAVGCVRFVMREGFPFKLPSKAPRPRFDQFFFILGSSVCLINSSNRHSDVVLIVYHFKKFSHFYYF